MHVGAADLGRLGHADIAVPHTPNLKILIVEDDETSKILISLTIKEYIREIMEVMSFDHEPDKIGNFIWYCENMLCSENEE